MNGKDLNFIGGIGLGALFMYLLDPQTGKRRRILARDKALRLAHKTRHAFDVTSRDLKNRAYGLTAKGKGVFSWEEVGDEVLEERVRSQLGFLVSHPHSIEVKAENGAVVLSGPILAEEVEPLLARVGSIRGVHSVENRLTAHESAESIPGLQGQQRRGGKVPEIMQANWSPATRFLMGTTAGALAWYGARQRTALGAAMAAMGAGIAARALANMEFKRLIGVGAGRRAIDVQKIINVAAPVHEVFSFWTNYENFPRFMSNVREVREIGANRSHWVVAGPAGANVEWDAVVTDYVPNKTVGWETVPGSPVQHAGVVRFQPNPDGTTRLDLKMSYNPIGGGLGHAIATLFGADIKSVLDEDLMRMKSLIETGVAPHDAARKNERIAYTH